LKTTARMFIAAELPADIREDIFIAAKRLQKGSGGRLIHPQNYHVTLAFLGNTPLEQAAGIKEALHEAGPRARHCGRA